jgi:hypothetical protein
MSGWTAEELGSIAATDEIEIATSRGDGALRKPVIVWVVRSGDALYVRSYKGPGAAWYRGTQLDAEGQISAGGVDIDVTFEPVAADLADNIDQAYRDKYGRFGPEYINAMVSPEVQATTLRLVPRSP